MSLGARRISSALSGRGARELSRACEMASSCQGVLMLGRVLPLEEVALVDAGGCLHSQASFGFGTG